MRNLVHAGDSSFFITNAPPVREPAETRRVRALRPFVDFDAAQDRVVVFNAGGGHPATVDELSPDLAAERVARGDAEWAD